MSEAAAIPPTDDAEPRARALLEQARALVAQTHPGRAAIVGLDSDIERDLGLDSLARVELLLRAQSVLGPLPERALTDAATLRELLALAGHAAHALNLDGAAAPLAAGEADWPAHAATLVEAFEWHARRHPQRTHVLLYGEADTPETLSYGALRAAWPRSRPWH